jgi:two-component system sensor histidine kinase EvgS
MTFRCLVFISILLSMVAAPPAAGAGENAATPIPYISSAAEIDYPPFSVVDADGRAGGFAVELMRAALAAMGRPVIFRTASWAEVKSWLERGEIQALPLVGRTPEREAVFDFTVPYMTLHGAIVVRKETADIQSLDDLKGRRVAVMQNDNAEEFLRREDRGIEMHATATFQEALRELSQGRHDAVVIQRLVALRLIQESGQTNLKILNQNIAGFRQDFCFAVREGDRETLAVLNEGLALVIADGTYRHLHAKWFAALELPNRRIVIGGDHNYPPYEYIDQEGRPAGYNVDLTRAIAAEVGLDIEIRLGPWQEIRNGLAHGEIDALQGMFYSTERDLTFDFTAPHVVNHNVSVVRQGEGPPPATPAELAGKRLIVQQGDIMHDFAVAQGLVERLAVAETQEAALAELAAGRHECALVSRLTALYWIEKNGWKNLTVGKKPLLSAEYCYAVPQNHQALLAQLAEGLKVLDESGEYRRIYEKWMGVYEQAQPDFEIVLRYAIVIAVPLVLLLLAFSFWSWSLRKEVARRTLELKLAEKAALAAAREWQTTFDATKDAIWVLDRDHRVLRSNQAAEQLFGLSKEQMLGKHCWEIMHGTHQAIHACPTLQAKQSLTRETLELENGASWFSVTADPILDTDGRYAGTVHIISDITDRKREEIEREKMQAQFLQAQKMESVGRLAGGVAHDFNNMLSVILGYTEMALENVAPSEPMHADLMEIFKAANRSSAVTRQLLAFARKQTIAPLVIDLNETIEGMLKMLRRLIGEDVELMWKPGKLRLSVKMDPSQIDQILANLCVNARDAIKDVGRITIETGQAVFDEAYCAEHAGFKPGDFVELGVGDNGCGMDARMLANIFEPFYTTKEVGQGTGLGLSTVYGIVQQNNGFIDVSSEPGQGTRFKIYLPRHAAQPVELLRESAQEMPLSQGETILLAEDDASLLNLCERMLKELGYTIISAETPAGVLRVAETHGGRIDLLITDVIMPEMNGRDLSNHLRSRHPNLKTLFMSGYTADVIAHREVLDEDVCFIPKPFTKRELAVKIREALAQEP